jgi:transposase
MIALVCFVLAILISLFKSKVGLRQKMRRFNLRRQKNDAADAAGICEAVTRPSMRFTGVRTLENQAALMHHKARNERNARN